MRLILQTAGGVGLPVNELGAIRGLQRRIL